jgi:hypothetical protein
VSAELPIEYRWEISGGRGFGFHWAKFVEEIPPERAEMLSDTMAPVEHLGSVAFTTAPWTFSAWTRRGLERKMRRYERKLGVVAERVYKGARA